MAFTIRCEFKPFILTKNRRGRENERFKQNVKKKETYTGQIYINETVKTPQIFTAFASKHLMRNGLESKPEDYLLANL